MFPASPGSPGACGPGSPPSRSLDDLLTCPVCLDNYNDPKTLVCLHSFCSKCLESCKRPYRRDIACPVCKKVTVLSPLGVQGLQNDFRIQQIRDILISRPQSPPIGADDASASMSDNKACDVCKTQQKKVPAMCHCIQCFMFFCGACKEKHMANPIFSSHHVLSVSDSTVHESLFCKTHKDQPVRYFCRTCNTMLCTVCTMEHEPRHTTEALDRAIIDRYRQELKLNLKTVRSKLSEVNNRTKYLETVKQSHQRALFKAQAAIREKTEEVVNYIRDQEQQLIQSVQEHMENKMKEHGMDMLGEISFHKTNMESLCADLNRVVQGSPQQCLVAYDELTTRMKAVSDTPLPALTGKNSPQVLKFVPSTEVNVLIGSLQECSLSDESGDDEANLSSSPSSNAASFGGSASKSQLVPRRVTSILSALSPNRKSESKKAKMKVFSNDQSPASPTNTICADDLIMSSTDMADDQVTQQQQGTSQSSSGSGAKAGGMAQPSSSPPPAPLSPLTALPAVSPTPGPISPPPGPLRAVSPITLPSSPSGSSIGASGDSDCGPGQTGSASIQVLPHYKPKLLFKLDQVGGWPGKVTSPTGVSFLPDGNLIVAECENRLQLFNKCGHSIRIIGWGKIRPHSVAVSREGHIVVTDKKDRNIKVYQMDGECKGAWGAGLLGSPSGVAIMSSNNYVVTDLERHSVSIHTPEGMVLTQFGSWGNGDYQFNNPSHVTVDQHDNIIVSDSGNSSIKIYDKAGIFLNKISLVSGKQGQLRRPQGVAVDNKGNLLVSDRDNHRISMFTMDGRFQYHVLTKQDTIKFPCDLAMDTSNNLAVVETHSGFLTKDPHHAVKLYQLKM